MFFYQIVIHDHDYLLLHTPGKMRNYIPIWEFKNQNICKWLSKNITMLLDL